ncbi:HIT domain-containing protein [Arthrobacter agilis]|uniref:HIT family protein n=1 Tax=Arthrobacter agilis TaxID=37921 RepID=UPI000B3528BB|nr:HIT domain-containing protein [Arthrobacter agilis]OUM45056.1 HIT family hydrolase [Arthrobacter agilis]PPB46878.1 HIT domain-containing protein [Arthrobacter agilis]TPV23531.1 HIT domain-containing protein [Arthrobacter agilis]VDR31930.1 AP-4-A phosphorylase [Arthrobacter agilis]
MGVGDEGTPAGASTGVYPGDVDVTDDVGLAGVPDAFQRLWTPHRLAYIKGGQDQVTSEHTCPFCRAPHQTDEEALIVHRGRHAFVLLNLFPYNAGHLLVCPYRHVPDYTDVDEAETAEIAALTQTAMRVLRRVASPTGFNLGMNQGATGGAGIAAHLHQHVVPRWGGDGNFLPIIAQTKAMTQTLGEVREQVAAAWPVSDDETGAAGSTAPC